MKTLSTALSVVFLGGLAAMGLFRLRRVDRVQGYRLICFSLAGAVILSRVLSPQYFVWALPLVLLLLIESAGSSIGFLWAGGAALVAVAALTSWVFPYHYFDFAVTPVGLVPSVTEPLPPSSAWSFAALGVRNLAYLACVVVVGVRLFARWPPVPSAMPGGDARAPRT